ncbi:unnamed protein product, partial [marine sediment metagenome]
WWEYVGNQQNHYILIFQEHLDNILGQGTVIRFQAEHIIPSISAAKKQAADIQTYH